MVKADEQVGRLVALGDVRPTSVFLVVYPESEAGARKFGEDLKRAFVDRGFTPLLIVVPDEKYVRVLPEEAMLEFGWVRPRGMEPGDTYAERITGTYMSKSGALVEIDEYVADAVVARMFRVMEH